MNRKLIIILALALIFRLYHIFFPVGGWHDWRQADTAAIARNFYQSGNSILYPQVDWRGSTQGYVESEFQIYTYTISLLYRVFGVHDYLGRIVSVIFSLFSVFGLYLIVMKVISERTALWAAFIYSVLPFNIYFSRVFMPESTMLMCSIYGLYFFLCWIEDNKISYYMLAVLFVSLACLIKLPTLYIGLPLAFIAYKKHGWKMFINPYLILMVFIVLIFIVMWYYHAHVLQNMTGLSFNIWNSGNDKWGMVDLLLKPKFYNDIFLRNLGERHLTYAGFVVFIWGLFLKRSHRYEMLFDFYLIAFLVFIFIAPQAHIAQDYYQLPFTIPASVFIAKILSKYINIGNIRLFYRQFKFPEFIAIISLLLILALSLIRYIHLMDYENIDAPLYKLTTEAKTIIPENDLILTVSDNNPVCLYLSERKGWTTYCSSLDMDYIRKVKSEGANYIIGEKRYFTNNSDKIELLRNNLIKIIDNEDYFVYKFQY